MPAEGCRRDDVVFDTVAYMENLSGRKLQHLFGCLENIGGRLLPTDFRRDEQGIKSMQEVEIFQERAEAAVPIRENRRTNTVPAKLGDRFAGVLAELPTFGASEGIPKVLENFLEFAAIKFGDSMPNDPSPFGRFTAFVGWASSLISYDFERFGKAGVQLLRISLKPMAGEDLRIDCPDAGPRFQQGATDIKRHSGHRRNRCWRLRRHGRRTEQAVFWRFRINFGLIASQESRKNQLQVEKYSLSIGGRR